MAGVGAPRRKELGLETVDWLPLAEEEERVRAMMEDWEFKVRNAAKPAVMIEVVYCPSNDDDDEEEDDVGIDEIEDVDDLSLGAAAVAGAMAAGSGAGGGGMSEVICDSCMASFLFSCFSSRMVFLKSITSWSCGSWMTTGSDLTFWARDA